MSTSSLSSPSPSSKSRQLTETARIPFPQSASRRSASRRSTRSTSTYSTGEGSSRTSNPAWRALSLSKGSSAQSSVSLVIAEPQLDSREFQSKQALSRASSSTGSRSRIPSGFLRRRSSKLDDMVDEANELATPDKLEDTTSQPATITTDTLSNSPPPDSSLSLGQPTEATPSSPVANSSWFASFGRAKGREKGKAVASLSSEPKQSEWDTDALKQTGRTEYDATTMQSERELETPTTETAPVPESVVESASIVLGSPSTPIKAASNSSSRRTWFPPSPRPGTSPTSPSPLQSISFPDSDDRQHPQRPPLSGSSSSFPSSIDEDHVPSLAQTPTNASDDERPPQVLPVHSPGDSSIDGDATVRARFNSLNPSSSRFTISLPLLGRQKMKLEEVVSKVNSKGDNRDTETTKDGTAGASEDSMSLNDANQPESTVESTTAAQWEGILTTMTTTNDSSTITTTTTIDDMFTATTTDSSSADSPVLESSTSPEARYSWWDYISWGSAASTRAAPGNIATSVPEESESESESESQVNAVGKEALGVDDGRSTAKPRSSSMPTNVDTPTSANAATTTGTWFSSWTSGAESGNGDGTTPEDTHKPASQSQVMPPVSPPITSNPSSQSHSSIATVKPSSDIETVKAASTSQRDPTVSEATAVQPSKALSVHSSDTAARGSWFAPWTWYATEPVIAKEEQSQEDGRAPTTIDSETTMTASEKIKEEALARQRALEAEQEQREECKHPKEAETSLPSTSNPLDQTITSRYSSGWASFFGTVSKRTKLVTEHGEIVKMDENGMEVMNLDEDEETPVGQAVKGTEEKPKNKDIERLKKSEEGKGGGRGNRPASVRSAPAVAPILNSSEPEKKIKKEKSKEHKEIKKGAPPTIIVSDTVRQEGESLLGKDKEKGKKKSPAPSVKSAPPNTTTSPSSPSTTEKKDKGRKSSSQPPPATKPAPPNLVLPTWADTFHTPPRSTVPPSAHKRVGLSDKDGSAPSVMGKLGRVGKWLLGSDQVSGGSSKRPGLRSRASSRSVHVVGNQPASSTWEEWGKALPRALDVLQGRGPPFEDPSSLKRVTKEHAGESEGNVAEQMSHFIAGKGSGGTGKEGDGAEGHVRDVLRGCKRVVVIGIHGWFPGAVMRTMLGEPTGTSPKFVNMMVQALEEFQEAHGVKLEKITKIPLEGEGTIDRRVEKLYNSLLSNEEWMSDLHEADAIFVSTHSQGSVVSTHLLDRLIKDGHIRTVQNTVATEGLTDLGVNLIPLRPQRVCCLALCGIHLGPLRYLRSSAIVQPYIQYFESAAARELFEFQNTENEVSKSYVKALRNVVNNGTKMVYVASLDDQVVPIYSGLFTSASHPLILRALYIDGNAYSSSDFLSNLLVLLLRILNCGLSDSGLLAHLSEVTAGSLNGVGHSTAYEELSTYALAVNYLFLTNDGLEEHPDLQVEPFNATAEQNDYEIPWALRDLIANERVAHFFSHEITQLRDAFHEWNPKTASLRDIKRKLQPIQRLPSTFSPGASNSVSKL